MPKKTALILSGGGARGIIQAGAIKYLVDRGITWDALYGISAGALNGVLLHAGQVNAMLDMWMTVRNSDVFNWAPWLVFTEKSCLLDSAPLRRTIARIADFKAAAANPVPFTVYVTDASAYAVDSRKATAPDFLDALLASASMPMAFPPVVKRGHYLYDGGLCNNFPIFDAIADGAERLILITPTIPEPFNAKTFLAPFNFLISASEYGYLALGLKFVHLLNTDPDWAKVEVILIQPKQPTGVGLLDFDALGKKSRRQELLQLGSDIAAACLAGLTL